MKMPPKIPIIDLDEIGKNIGLKLYLLLEKNGITQTELAEKMWVSVPAISVFLTGKKTTWNLEQYRKIAEAIPISRAEFDKIVETAKAEVLGFSGHNSWTKIDRDMAISFLAHDENVSENDIKQALRAIKLFKSGQ